MLLRTSRIPVRAQEARAIHARWIRSDDSLPARPRYASRITRLARFRRTAFPTRRLATNIARLGPLSTRRTIETTCAPRYTSPSLKSLSISRRDLSVISLRVIAMTPSPRRSGGLSPWHGGEPELSSRSACACGVEIHARAAAADCAAEKCASPSNSFHSHSPGRYDLNRAIMGHPPGRRQSRTVHPVRSICILWGCAVVALILNS